MADKHTPLVADGDRVRNSNGDLIATVWTEYPSKQQLPGESWFGAHERTQPARDAALAMTQERARLFAAAPELSELAKEARTAMTAYLEDHPHNAPHDCYATGPKTGDEFHDLVRCPGCCAENAFTALIAKIDAALAKARGEA